MRTIYSLAIACLVLFVATIICTFPLTPSIPAIQLTFSESAFRAVLDAWQAPGVERFKLHLAIDFPFLLCYGMLGFLVARRTRLLRAFRRRARTLLAFSLPLAVLADGAENLFHLHFVFGSGPLGETQYVVAGLAAALKWALIATFFCASAYSGFRITHSRYRRVNN